MSQVEEGQKIAGKKSQRGRERRKGGRKGGEGEGEGEEGGGGEVQQSSLLTRIPKRVTMRMSWQCRKEEGEDVAEGETGNERRKGNRNRNMNMRR